MTHLQTTRNPQSSARRDHIHGPLQGWSESVNQRPNGEPHPCWGVCIATGCLAVLILLSIMLGA